jgi:hypothetical protein
MKILSSLVILAYFVGCNAQEEWGEYCQELCADKCVPCEDQIKCTEEETDCGLGKPDPAFGGVCPAHYICVPKDKNCKSIY